MSLDYKVFDNNKKQIASLRYAEDAAAVVANYHAGSIKYNNRIVWSETKDGKAGDSFDYVASSMLARIANHNAQYAVKNLTPEQRTKFGLTENGYRA